MAATTWRWVAAGIGVTALTAVGLGVLLAPRSAQAEKPTVTVYKTPT